MWMSETSFTAVHMRKINTNTNPHSPNPFQSPNSMPPRQDLALHGSSAVAAKSELLSTFASSKGPPATKPVKAVKLTMAFKNSGGGAAVASYTACQMGAKDALSKVIKAIMANPF